MAARVSSAQFIGWDGQSPHYTFGLHPACSTGVAGSDRRAALFEAYAAGLSGTFPGLFDMPAREAWAEANELVEGADVSWSYRRATSPAGNTYAARLRDTEPAELGSGRTFFTSRGGC